MNTISRKYLIPSLFVAALLTMIGCAGIPNSTPCSGMMAQSCYPGMMTQNLYGAGFIPMPMNACQPGLFEALPPNKITTIQRNGNTYYAYADQSSHQVLMGQSSALKNYNSRVSRQLPALARSGQQAEKNFVTNGLTPQQRRSLAVAGRKAKNSWKNIFHRRHENQSAPVASNLVSASKESGSIAKELPSSKSIERQAGREWKKVGF